MAHRIRWHFNAHLHTTPQGFHRPRVGIIGSMSANAVARHYPSTQALFEQLHIDQCLEGYESLEELAWRHGMDVAHFIAQLDQEASRQRQPHKAWSKAGSDPSRTPV